MKTETDVPDAGVHAAELEKTEYRSAIRLLSEVAKRFMWSNPNRWVKQITWLRDENGVHVYEVEHYFFCYNQFNLLNISIDIKPKPIKNNPDE
jgi:hypothetical protein